MNMRASARCKALITEFEGLGEVMTNGMVRAYPDPASPMGQGKYPKNGPDVSKGAPWTIGFGATGKGITRGTLWTLKQCEMALDNHIDEFEAGVNRLLKGAETTQNQFDALVSFAYNLGLGNLERSTLLRLHRAGDYEGASKQFASWNKAQGKVLAGLTRRRAAEAALYATK